VFLERPAEPAAAVFTQADAAMLHERLLQVAGGVLDERWPVTHAPHRGLCGDCPARRALCSHPESLTLREAPDGDDRRRVSSGAA
jgi:ATP-dependent helicase/nuclease subunit A